jgi:serine/threonine-protein kinase
MKETPPRGVRAGVLAGRYRLLAHRRRGMGSVHRVVHEGLDREVAVKFIGGRGAAVQVQRFEREARLLARLSLPSIVTVHDFGRAGDGTWFLLLELVRGVSLQASIAAAPLAMLEAVDVARHIALDLKPGNVMLSAATASPVQLIDFGLARVRSTTTRAHWRVLAGAQPLTMARDRIRGTAP